MSDPALEKQPNRNRAQARAASACGKHLKDLEQAHGRPPPDVAAPMDGPPQVITPVPVGSYCTSPAQLCAELGEE